MKIEVVCVALLAILRTGAAITELDIHNEAGSHIDSSHPESESELDWSDSLSEANSKVCDCDPLIQCTNTKDFKEKYLSPNNCFEYMSSFGEAQYVRLNSLCEKKVHSCDEKLTDPEYIPVSKSNCGKQKYGIPIWYIKKLKTAEEAAN